MYSPGKGRDDRVFNLPAINFNRIPGCCTAWTLVSSLRLLPRCFYYGLLASASFKRMSDFFLLPCAIAPPSLPTLAGLSYTHYAFHTRSAPPRSPPPFFLFFAVSSHAISL